MIEHETRGDFDCINYILSSPDLVDAVGGDGGRRRGAGAGGVGEVAAGERALEQRPPLHRLRRRPVRVRRRHLLTRMGRPCPQSGRNGGDGRGGRRGSCSPRFPVSDIAGLSIGGRCYSASCLLSGCAKNGSEEGNRLG